MQAQTGFTLIELVVAVALVGVLMGVAVFEFRDVENPANNGAAQLASFFKETRAKALASTLAYTITPQSTTKIVTTKGKTCEAAQTPDNLQSLTLPSGSSLLQTSWAICYNARGVSNNSFDIHIADENSSKVVQVVLGGGVRVQ